VRSEGALQGDRKNAAQVFSLIGLTKSLSGEESLDELMGEIRPLRQKTGAQGLKGLAKQR